jgi:hypothetical protein
MTPGKPSKLRLYADLIRRTSVSQLYRRARRMVLDTLGRKVGLTFCEPVTEDDRLVAALRSDVNDLESVVRAWKSGGSSDAVSLLASHFKSRECDVYPLCEQRLRESASLISEEFPHLDRKIRREAEGSLEHRFEFEGSGIVDFGRKIDWESPALRTCEQIYALNRLYHMPTLGRAYILTGDSRYVAEFADLIAQWLSANKKPYGRPWNVLTTALRLNAWIEAYGCLRTSTALSDEAHVNMAKAVVSHADFLTRQIEYDLANNHLVFEGRTLVSAGTAFPEFRQAAKWRALGMKLLDRELVHQVRPDGCHAEQSVAYHLQVMWEYLYAWTVLESSVQEVPRSWREVLSKMADFVLDVVRPDGGVPMIGDSASWDPQTPLAADVLAVASVVLCRPDLRQRRENVTEKAVSLLGARAPEAVIADNAERKPRPSVCYPDGGYCVMRSDDQNIGCHAVFDCGPFGLENSPGHGHADALSFEFSAFGRSLLIDPGVYTYEPGRWRDFFRSTRAHNTVVVDGQDQAYLWGAFRVYRPRAAVLNTWESREAVTFADASYRWASAGVTHRRAVALINGRFLLLYDYLDGDGDHEFLLSYHFPPSDAHVVSDHNQTALCTSVQQDHGEAAGVAVLCHLEEGDTVRLLCGSEQPIQGWVSYEKGKKLEAPALEVHRRARVPTAFVSLAYPFLGGAAPDDLSLHVSRESDVYGSLVAVVADGRRYDIFVNTAGLTVNDCTDA